MSPITNPRPKMPPPDALRKYSVVIDTDDLMSRCFGNIDFINRILCILKDRCDAEMVELERAADELNVEHVYSIAHRLKGALANASASELSSLADQICLSLTSENIGVTKSMIRELRKGWDRLSVLIDREASVPG